MRVDVVRIRRGLARVPVGATAGDKTPARLPRKPSPRALGQVAKVRRVLPRRQHRDERPGLLVGEVRAARHREHGDAEKTQPLQRASRFFDVAPQTGLVLNEDCLERLLPGSGE